MALPAPGHGRLLRRSPGVVLVTLKLGGAASPVPPQGTGGAGYPAWGPAAVALKYLAYAPMLARD